MADTKNIKKKKYKKKNEFKFNIIFDNKAETFENVVERAFKNYIKIQIQS